jgi:septum formation protein
MNSELPVFILASNSPARAQILSQINFNFIVEPSNISENASMENPKAYVSQLAFEKAKTVGSRIKGKYSNYIVLGCDTIVFDPLQQVVGKPEDRDHAKQMLTNLSDSSHLVITGCSLIVYPSKHTYQGVITTEVIFRDLTEEEIDFYIASNEWKGKAGGYAIQGLGSFLIKEIKGDYYNIVGLPISWVWQILFKHFGTKFLKRIEE